MENVSCTQAKWQECAPHSGQVESSRHTECKEERGRRMCEGRQVVKGLESWAKRLRKPPGSFIWSPPT